MKQVIILMCNSKQIMRAAKTIHELRVNGRYIDDIVLFFDEDIEPYLYKLEELKSVYNLILKKFPKIDSSTYLTVLERAKFDWGYDAKNKLFILHKFYVFDVYFKQWDKVLYIDAGMHIYNNIYRILNLDCKDVLLAHSNSYPYNYFRWNLDHQFNLTNEPDIVKKLYNNFDMTIKDNLQTTMLLFDTSIILDDTVSKLIELLNEYPICKAVDQGYMCLYFQCIRNIWKPIPIMDNEGFLYDYMERYDYKYNEYVMLKGPRTDPNI